MTDNLKELFLFGAIDGLNGMVGLVIGLSRSSAAASLIFVALLARAGSSAVSMGGAEFESDTSSDSRKMKTWRVGAMSAGYLASALVPGLGFAISTSVGWIVFVPATIVALFAITRFRSRRVGWLKAAGTTMLIFTLAVAAGFLASLLG